MRCAPVESGSDAATAQHPTTFTTQVVDLDRHQVLDVIAGRSRAVLGGWLAERGVEWCARIRLATLDPAAGYRAALDEPLPRATRVVDHFHAIKLANTAIDDVRRPVQQETLHHRGRKGNPLYRGRRVLPCGDERLTPERATLAGYAARGSLEGPLVNKGVWHRPRRGPATTAPPADALYVGPATKWWAVSDELPKGRFGPEDAARAAGFAGALGVQNTGWFDNAGASAMPDDRLGPLNPDNYTVVLGGFDTAEVADMACGLARMQLKQPSTRCFVRHVEVRPR